MLAWHTLYDTVRKERAWDVTTQEQVLTEAEENIEHRDEYDGYRVDCVT
jgi:hypothetical protein